MSRVVLNSWGEESGAAIDQTGSMLARSWSGRTWKHPIDGGYRFVMNCDV